MKSKKFKWKILISLALTMFCFCGLSQWLFASADYKEEQSGITLHKNYDITTANNGAYADKGINQSISDENIYYKSYYSGGTVDFNSGYMYEADKKGSTSTIRLIDVYSGEFSIVGTGFYDADGSPYDYGRLAFTFTNSENTEQYVKFTFTQSSNYDYIAFNAYYYDLSVQNTAVYKTSSDMNLMASFSATALYFNNKKPAFKFSYDNSTQTINLARTDGVKNHDLNALLDTTLSSFSSYSVDMSFENKSQTTTAKFIVYELCGQVLSGENPVNTAGARITVNPVSKIVNGFEYCLPAPNIYDVLDGDLSSEATCRVLYGTTDVPVNDGKFMPVGCAEPYTVIYSVTDSGDIITEKSIEIDALSYIPHNELEFSGNIEDVYPDGSLIKIPSLKVYSALAYKKTLLPSYTLIQKDGAVLKRIENGENRNYRINGIGKYDIVYTYFNELGVVATETKSFTAKDLPRFSETEIPDNIFIGKEFYVPELKLIYGDEQLLADFEVFSPKSEKLEVENRTFVPQEKGVYSIVYNKEYNDVIYSKTCLLNSGVGAATIIENVSGVLSVEGNADLPSYSVSGNGVKVLADSRTSTFRFINPIDLNAIGADKNVIALQVLSGEGYASFTELIIELIDAENSQNTVKFKYRYNQWNDTYSYVLLNYNGKSLGIRNESGHVGEVDNYFGAVTHNSFSGYKYNNKQTFAVRVDNEERQFFVREINDRFYMLLDADDPEIVGDNIWSGFTSGRVYVQVSMQTLYDVGGVIVTELGGQSLSGTILDDNVPPNAYFEKNIHVSDYSSMPKGVKGYEYRLPTVNAEDLFSAKCNVERKLYYVGLSGDELIEVESGVDVFIPDKTGNYKIVYKVSDIYGNDKIVELNFTIEESRGISVDFETAPSVAVVGQRYYVPKLVVSGASGEAVLEYYVFYNGREIYLPRTRQVYTDSVGEIRIVYNVSDYIESDISDQFIITVNDSDCPIIEVSEAMPITVVKGTVFTLPSFKVKNTGGSLSDVPLWIEIDDEVFSEKSFIVEKNAGEKINIIVYAGNAPYISRISYTVNIISPVYLTDYIIVENDINVEKKNEKFQAEIITEEDNVISLPNPLVCDDMIISFAVGNPTNVGAVDEYCDSVDIVLFDTVYREDRKIVLTLKPDSATKSELILNGNNTEFVAVDGSFYNTKNVFYFTFDAKTKTLRDISGNLLFNILEFDNGDYFEGFSGGAAYMSFYINGVKTGKSVSLQIIQVSNQSFTSKYKNNVLQEYNDNTPPVLFFGQKLYNFSTDINTTLVIPYAYAYDVLGGKRDLKVTLIAPDGHKVVENASCDVNISRVLDSYGTYTIRYITDNNGKNYLIEYYVKVKYKVKPEISVAGSLKEEYAVGEDINIPESSVVNNVRGDCEIFVYIQYPSARIVDITDKNQLNLSTKGEFRIIYYAIDSEYNFSEKIYKFTVK